MDAVEESEVEEPEEPPKPSRWRRMMAWLPAWVTAVVLVTLLTAVQLFLHRNAFVGTPWPAWLQRTAEIATSVLIACVIFLAGALKRGNWRHALVMVGVGVAAQGWSWCHAKLLKPAPFPYSLVVWGYAIPLFVGLGEWMLAKGRNVRGLAAVVVAAVTAAFLIPLIQKPLQYANLQFVARWLGYEQGQDFGTVIDWPLVALVTWVAIPLALRVAVSRRRRPRLIAAGAAVCCVAGFVWFFHVGVYWVALQSLERQGPFDRTDSALIVEMRGRASDYEALWRAIERADWQEQFYLSAEQRARQTWLSIVMRHNPPQAAARLAGLVRKRPSAELARATAEFLGEHHRQEVAPVLLWHAMDVFSCAQDECRKALERMDLPWSAMVLIYQIPRVRMNNDEDATNPTLTGEERAMLARWLGRDMGEKYKPWVDAGDELLRAATARYPASFRDDMDFVCRCAAWYITIRARRYEAECRLFVRRVEEAGKGAVMQNLVEKRGELKELGLWPDDIARLEIEHRVPGWRNAEPVFEKMRNSARKDMKVPAPVWRREGVKALEEEVARYEREVDEKIARLLPPATRPATQPATRAGTRRDQGER